MTEDDALERVRDLCEEHGMGKFTLDEGEPIGITVFDLLHLYTLKLHDRAGGYWGSQVWRVI